MAFREVQLQGSVIRLPQQYQNEALIARGWFSSVVRAVKVGPEPRGPFSQLFSFFFFN